MKLKLSTVSTAIIAVLGASLSTSAMAATSQTESPANNQYISLAASNNVYFETFAKTNYDLDVLQAKNKLPTTGVAVGGQLELDAQAWRGSLVGSATNAKAKGSQLMFSSFALDTMANINQWVSAFARINNAGPNSYNMNLDLAFVTFGNLEKSPIYVIAGRNYVPFGSFTTDSLAWSNGLDTNTFRVNANNQINIGYYANGVKLNGVIFQNKASKVNDFVLNARYEGVINPEFNYVVGAGYLHDIRYNNSAWGTEGSDNKGITDHQLPVMDLNAKINWNNLVTVSGEFNKVLRRVNTTNTLTITNKKPYAWAVGTAVTPVIYGKTTRFLVAYSKTKNMQGLASPLAITGPSGAANNSSSGLKHAWDVSVSRPIINDNNTISADFQRVTSYDHKHSSAYTVDYSLKF